MPLEASIHERAHVSYPRLAARVCEPRLSIHLVPPRLVRTQASGDAGALSAAGAAV